MCPPDVLTWRKAILRELLLPLMKIKPDSAGSGGESPHRQECQELSVHSLPSFAGFSYCCPVHLLTEGWGVDGSSSSAISWSLVATGLVLPSVSHSQLRKTGTFKASLEVELSGTAWSPTPGGACSLAPTAQPSKDNHRDPHIHLGMHPSGGGELDSVPGLNAYEPRGCICVSSSAASRGGNLTCMAQQVWGVCIKADPCLVPNCSRLRI